VARAATSATIGALVNLEGDLSEDAITWILYREISLQEGRLPIDKTQAEGSKLNERFSY
jgi:hypothetical protein